MSAQVEMFFRLLRGIYGASKFESQWPTDLDLQAVQILWADEINKHTPEELRACINHAQHMATMGESDWQWPNVGLILSGARRHLCAAHRGFLPESERNPVPQEEAAQRAAQLREML